MLTITCSVILHSRICYNQNHAKSSSLNLCSHHLLGFPKEFHGIKRLRFLVTNQRQKRCSNTNMNMRVYSSGIPGPPIPSDPSNGSWKIWIVGMLISVILPFWKNKWGPLLKLKQEVETMVETVEEVVDIVETVAEKVEEVAEEIADHLPEGGKLRNVAIFVENVARETAKDAHLAEQVIDKVEEMEKEVESFFEADQENQKS